MDRVSFLEIREQDSLDFPGVVHAHRYGHSCEGRWGESDRSHAVESPQTGEIEAEKGEEDDQKEADSHGENKGERGD
jgi:hypothetical protein